MGRRFYGKIVSLIGNGFGADKGGFFKNMLKFKMMSTMMGGSGVGGDGLAMMMLMGNGSMDGLFDGFADDADDEDDEDGSDMLDTLISEDEDDEEEKPAKKTVKKASKKRK